MINKTPPKGMRDFLPQDLAFRNNILSKIKSGYSACGFYEIETPCVDDIALLMSKQGGDNEKLMYKILKRGEKLQSATADDMCDLGLRFDLTLPLARYCANNAGNIPPVFKAMQIGPVFRADRPQKGRFRQFIQCDIDILGEETILAEIDLICATVTALQTVGLRGFSIKINDRRILRELAIHCGFDEGDFEKVFITLDKLDKIGMQGVETELREYATDSQTERFLTVINEIYNSDDSLTACGKVLGESVAQYISELQQIILTANKVANAKVNYDITLVRGMNYYTGAIFEIYVENVPYSVGGGGRYDKLLGKITGTNVPACGFSIGFERIVDLLATNSNPRCNSCTAIFVPKNCDDITSVMTLAKEMRKDGNVSIYKKMKNFAYQLKALSDIGCDKFYQYDNGQLKEITK